MQALKIATIIFNIAMLLWMIVLVAKKKIRHKCRVQDLVAWLWWNNRIFDHELAEMKR